MQNESSGDLARSALVVLKAIAKLGGESIAHKLRFSLDVLPKWIRSDTFCEAVQAAGTAQYR